MSRYWLCFLTSVALATGSLASQVAPDRDRGLLPAGNNPAPNGTRNVPGSGVRNALYVRSLISWTGGRHTVGSLSSPCDLVVEAGGTLEVTDSQMRVFGDVVLRPGGLLRVRDADFTLGNQVPQQFFYHFEGGQLDTLRTSIGGNPATGGVANFLLDKGLWHARNTVVNYSGGILVGNPRGRLGDQARTGGTLLADGLLAGESADYVTLGANGGVTLHNSAFRIALRFFDTGPTTSPVQLNLNEGELIPGPLVFGDPNVHDGTNRPAVTNPVRDSPWRLELVNSTVAEWAVQFFDADPSGSPRVYELQNAETVPIGIQGRDLTGSPVLIGPWTNYYPPPYELPGLPTVTAPGYHSMPPGCGVRIGSVTIISAPNAWSTISSWALYLNGTGAFSVTGPARIGEMVIGDDVHVILEGVEGFDTGLRCVTGWLWGNSRLTMRDATVGSEAAQFGSLRATGNAVVDLDRVRLRRLQLRTGPQTVAGRLNGVDNGAIVLGRHVRSPAPGEVFTTSGSPGGTITFSDDEFANNDFEGAVVGGVPSNWSTSNVTCSQSTNTRPHSPGSRSVLYQSNTAWGGLQRSVVLPERTPVEVFAWVAPVTTSGGQFRLRLRDAASQVSADLPTSGGWQFVRLPPFTVGSAINQVILEVVHSGAAGPVSMRIDDVIVRTPGYWETDNLLNLGFEEPRRRTSRSTSGTTLGPDYWATLHAAATSITTGLRAGATGRAAQLDIDGPKGVLDKELYFPVPGQTMVVSGWVKTIRSGGGSFPVDIYLNTGKRYWDLTLPNAQRQQLLAPGQWTQFSLTYTVPAPSAFQGFTTFAIAGGTVGDRLLVDDVTVTFQ
ncbi:MAG: hypothetical protein NXI31_20570 [bacterium]|nr:hypothetical protein [bacterium]